MKIITLGLMLFLAAKASAADSTAPAATAINSMGVDLLHVAAHTNANALFSPYSIQSVLAMTYAGADGATRDEMSKALHFGTNEAQLHASFRLLQRQLQYLTQRSAKSANEEKDNPWNHHDPITFTVANRLFAQSGYPFRADFLDRVSNYYRAPLLQMDFSRDPDKARNLINEWVNTETRQRIPNLIPEPVFDAETRLVLVNAMYLKAPWASCFDPRGTRTNWFQLSTGYAETVPMMWQRESVGYQKYNDFTAVAVPYAGEELQFLILLPDATNGLAALESRITQFAAYANLPKREIILGLPKFKMTPPTMSLNSTLQELGMNSAFNSATANFQRMANRPIFIQGVFHKAFIAVDEKGTEAAAATAAVAGEGIPEKTITVTVDHPFLFAIQHRASGACLFLGHVVDPW